MVVAGGVAAAIESRRNEKEDRDEKKEDSMDINKNVLERLTLLSFTTLAASSSRRGLHISIDSSTTVTRLRRNLTQKKKEMTYRTRTCRRRRRR